MIEQNVGKHASFRLTGQLELVCASNILLYYSLKPHKFRAGQKIHAIFLYGSSEMLPLLGQINIHNTVQYIQNSTILHIGQYCSHPTGNCTTLRELPTSPFILQFRT